MLWFAILSLSVAGILSFSPEENEENFNSDLFEGDMILPIEEKLELMFGQSRGAHNLRRWPNGVVPYTIDWVLVVPADVGYWGYQQYVNLAPGCWHMGTVAHEIGHAQGFFHEQSRPDRDRYVRVMWYNVQEGKGYNFMKINSINSLGEPYDYDSLMHYGKKFFSKNGRPTLLPRKKGIEFGQRERVSEGDARQMKKMYNCP